MGYEYDRAIRERSEAKTKIGMEYVLKEDATLGDMFQCKVAIPKGTKVKVIGYDWAYGYYIRDNKGRKARVWTIKE